MSTRFLNAAAFSTVNSPATHAVSLRASSPVRVQPGIDTFIHSSDIGYSPGVIKAEKRGMISGRVPLRHFHSLEELVTTRKMTCTISSTGDLPSQMTTTEDLLHFLGNG